MLFFQIYREDEKKESRSLHSKDLVRPLLFPRQHSLIILSFLPIIKEIIILPFIDFAISREYN